VDNLDNDFFYRIKILGPFSELAEAMRRMSMYQADCRHRKRLLECKQQRLEATGEAEIHKFLGIVVLAETNFIQLVC